MSEDTIKDFDLVVITKDIEEIKAGTVGTAVDCLAEGKAWLVETLQFQLSEFSDGLVAVPIENLVPVQTIKFMNDHCTTSLWWDSHNKVEPLDYDELPLSKELVEILEKRDEEYTNSLNWEDPASTPDLTEEELKAFEAEGVTLWRRLQEELKPFYKVTFFSEVLRRVVGTEAELTNAIQEESFK